MEPKSVLEIKAQARGWISGVDIWCEGEEPLEMRHDVRERVMRKKEIAELGDVSPQGLRSMGEVRLERLRSGGTFRIGAPAALAP